MKRAYLPCTIIILLFALILMLSGCGGAVSDEAQIRSVIDGFSNAMISQNWDKARSYCVSGSEEYNAVNDLEAIVDQANLVADSVVIGYNFVISNISVMENYATVDGFLTLTMTENGDSQIVSGNHTANLEKVDDSWDLY